MKNKKWIMALLLSALMIVCLFSLVACDEGAGGGYEGGGDTPNVSSTPSEGLKFTINEDNTAYSVADIGTCTDTDVVITSSYNGLPVTGIVDYAFDDCTSLTSVTIPDSVTSIGRAFSGCESLNAVYISDIAAWCGISFGANPLLYANNLYLNGTLVTDLVIPSGVTSIGDRAFSGCTSLTSVTIPNSVTSIGDGAFYDCTSLTSVTIGKEVTSIGIRAFDGCTSLTSITILGNVTSIWERAFDGCTSLTSVTIGNGVTSIDSTICNIATLTNITVGENNPNYKSIDGNLYSKDGSELIRYASGKSATSFAIPDGVTSIGAYAFDDCTSLTSITIPTSLTSIDGSMFEDCTSLANIIVKIGNPAYKSTDGNLYRYGRDIYGKELIKYAIGKPDTSFTIPDNITSIASGAFLGCTSLTSITIPDSVESLGEYAFGGCSSLTSITIPDSWRGIPSSIYNIETLTSITVNESNPNCKSIDGNLYSKDGSKLIRYATGKSDTSVVIPDNVTSIGDKAFYDFTSLTSITIPDSVTSIGSSAFTGCTNLTSITIPDSVTSIGSSAFTGCTNLASVTIGNGVTTIGDWAFYDCTSLTSIAIPDSVTSIGNSAFYGCKGLTSVTIGNGITSIRSNVFTGCTSLTSVTIPDSVTSIISGAFLDCTSLTSITISDSVMNIGDEVFGRCESLTTITIPNSVTSIERRAFKNCTSLTEVIFDGTKAQWEAINLEDGWKDNAPFTVVHCSDGDVNV